MDSTQNPANSPFTRRRILGWGGAGAIGGLAGYLGWPRGQAARAPLAKEASPRQSTTALTDSAPAAPDLTRDGSRRDDFLPHLNSLFRVTSPTLASVDCKLVEISSTQKLTGPAGNFTAFSLLFSAPTGSVTESQIYQVSHPQMGSMELFLSPVGKPSDRISLEAVFSQRA